MITGQIVVLDYGLGNIRSISNALIKTGAEPVISRDPAVIAAARGLVIPGVGAFGHGMANLREYGLIEPIQRFVASGKPVLGICLGMQLLMDRSEEHGQHEGLGLIPGDVAKLPIDGQSVHRLPHVMWNKLSEINLEPGGLPLLRQDDLGKYFYFVHSFAARPKDRKNGLAWTRYADLTFCSAVQKGNVVGFQFHPEKSGPDGLVLLERYVQECRGS